MPHKKKIFILTLFLLAASALAYSAPDPGHDPSEIGPGTFDKGDGKTGYTFPYSVIAPNFIDSDATGYVINPTGDSYFNKLLITSLKDCAGKLYTGSGGQVFCGTDAIGTDDQTCAEVTGCVENAITSNCNGTSCTLKDNNIDCNTVDTDASGNLICGTDAIGTDDQTCAEVTGCVENAITSNCDGTSCTLKDNNIDCNTVDTDASGNLICGTDAIGTDDQTLSEVLTAGNNAGGKSMVNLGNVGIGTVNALAKLNVDGGNTYGIRSVGNSAGVFGIAGQSSGSYGLYGSDNAYNANWGGYFAGSVKTTKNLIVDGNVGIGKTDPGEALDVFGNIKASGTICGSAGCVGDSGGAWTISGSDVYRSSGNVGIGVATPGAKLDVQAGSSAKFKVVDKGNFVFDAGADVTVGSILGAAGKYSATGVYSKVDRIKDSNDKNIGVYGYTLGSGGTNIGLQAYAAGGTDNYGIYSIADKNYFSGSVGIGTTNPGAKLEVAGQVKITGGSPGTDKVLTSDASGLATWQTPDSVSNRAWWTSRAMTNYNAMVNTGCPSGWTDYGIYSYYDSGNLATTYTRVCYKNF